MIRTRIRWTIVLMASLLSWVVSAQTVRYVVPNGTGDGSSWQNASGDLQVMIDASQIGDEVWIAAGTYKPTRLIKSNRPRSLAFFLKSGVSLYGGFAGTELAKTDRKLKEGGLPYEFVTPTILSADDDIADIWTREIEAGSSYRYGWRIEGNEKNANHLLFTSTKLTAQTIIDGLTLTGAYADVWQAEAGGAAIHARGHIEVRACSLVRNAARNPVEGKAFYGGAVCLLETDGKAVIEDCLFEQNMTRSSSELSQGGGVYNDGGIIRRCTFRACVSLDEGGAIYNKNGRVEDCFIEDGYAASGGGIYNTKAGEILRAKIYHCRGLKGAGICNKGNVRHSIIANCYADATEFGDDAGGSGGGVEMTSGRIVGSVIYNCMAFTGGGVGLKGGSVYNSTIQNCAARKNGTNPNVYQEAAEGTKIINSIIEPNTDPSNFLHPTTYIGNPKTTVDSVAIPSASWQLSPSSAFIDQGEINTDIVEETDILGNPRVTGGTIDRGAHEAPATKKPNIIATFASIDKEVKIGTGGSPGTSFSIDWGDGELIAYEGAKNIVKKPLANQVKIYGDNLVIIQIIDQGLTDLDVTQAPLLSRIQVGKNALMKLDVSQNKDLTGLYCEQNQVVSLDVVNNTLLRVLDCHANKISGRVDCAAMTKLTKLDCSDNAIESLLLPSTTTLTTVDCGMNRLASLDVSKLSELSELSCNDNLLAQIDLKANTKLYNLYCPNNKLTTLNLEANAALTKLSANKNELTGLDLTKNKNLTGLYLQHNKISTLDLTTNVALGWINVEDNRLSAIDLSNLADLKLLNAAHNRIEQLNLTANAQINTLHVGNNSLETLDLSKQPNLIWLTCDSNKLSTLDLQSNANLSWLECESNMLSTLNISKQKNLQKLFAGHNKLKSFDLTANTGIQGLFIESNLMDTPAIDAILTTLPNVKSVEIHDNNRTWARQLNISMMPGTKNARKTDAESKGWQVKADFDTSTDHLKSEITQWWYDATHTTLYASSPLHNVRIYGADGRLVLAVQNAYQLSVALLPEGLYIAIATDTKGVTTYCKFVR